MANAKDIIATDTNILLVGDSGTHKTFLAGMFPSPYFFDFDKGMATLRGRDIEFDTFKEAAKGVKVPKEQTERDGIYEFARGWPAFITKMNSFAPLINAGKFPYKTIVLDSLTFMSEIAMNHVLHSTNQDFPHQGSYGAQQQYIKRVLNEITAWPVRLIATAHIQRDTNDLTQITEKLPLLTGKLAGLIGAYFDEVYFMESKPDAKGEMQYSVLTQQTPQMRQAKTRWGVPNGTSASYEDIVKYFPTTPSPAPAQMPAPAPGARPAPQVRR